LYFCPLPQGHGAFRDIFTAHLLPERIFRHQAVFWLNSYDCSSFSTIWTRKACSARIATHSGRYVCRFTAVLFQKFR